MDTGIKVGDCMKTLLVTINHTDTVVEAAKAMKKKDVGSVLVTGGKGNIEAIATDEDIVRKAVALGKLDLEIGKIASKPLVTISALADLNDAAKQMSRKKLRRLVVVDSAEKVVGMISQSDIMELSPSLYDLIAEREHVEAESRRD